MEHLLVEFAKWLENLGWVNAMGSSPWIYPFIQTLHFTGLSLWVGTNIALDLHLMCLGKRQQTAAQFSEALFVWNWIGFAVVITGGALLFVNAASTYLSNPAFDMKLGLLIPLALIFHVIVQQKTRTWGQTMDVPTIGKVAGAIEILLWFSVASAAVAIPYF